MRVKFSEKSYGISNGNIFINNGAISQDNHNLDVIIIMKKKKNSSMINSLKGPPISFLLLRWLGSLRFSWLLSEQVETWGSLFQIRIVGLTTGPLPANQIRNTAQFVSNRVQKFLEVGC